MLAWDFKFEGLGFGVWRSQFKDSVFWFQGSSLKALNPKPGLRFKSRKGSEGQVKEAAGSSSPRTLNPKP